MCGQVDKACWIHLQAVTEQMANKAPFNVLLASFVPIQVAEQYKKSLFAFK